MLRWTEPSIGDGIVNIVLSMNEQVKALHKMDVDLTTYSHIKPTLKSMDEIFLKLDEVDKGIKDVAGHPGEYMREMALAMRYYSRFLQGDIIPYDEMIMKIHQLPCDLISEVKSNLLKDKLERQLSDFNYKGSLKEKADKWLSDTRIPAESVIKVADSLIKKAKVGTLQRVTELPEGDGIDSINPISGVFWSGLSVYVGNYRGKLTFNIERPWSEPTFAQVLTHEAYPGHQTFYCRWDYLYKQGKLPLEASYYYINSPTNALFEGAPETALHFLGWDAEDESSPELPTEAKSRYAAARNFLDIQRIAQTNACYLLNIHHAEKEEVIDYMMKVGLFNRLEAENTYRYFTHPVQKYYYPTYYHGRWIVWKAYDLIPKEKRSEFFRILYDTPHTTNTFISAIKTLTGKDFGPFIG